MVSKKFHEIATERRLWQKLPINLTDKQVPVEFVQHVMKHGIAYINLDHAGIFGDSTHFAQQNSLKYLIVDLGPACFQIQREVKKNLLASSTQLEKLSCIDITKIDYDDIFQCIEQNGESLRCLEIDYLKNLDYLDLNDDWTIKTTAIKKCNQLEELRLDYCYIGRYGIMDVMKNLPQNLKKLSLGWLKIEEFKVLVATCSKLEDLFLRILCCNNSPCHHFDEVISIFVGSPLSETLVNLSLGPTVINVDEQFDAKCLELRKMKKLEKIEVVDSLEEWDEDTKMEAKNILEENLPHVTIIEDIMDRKHENFFIPADPYAKYNRSSGFWEIRCNRPPMFLNL